MKVSGVGIIRNGVKYGYPFVESIKSVLPLCDEFVAVVGDSDDGTRAKVEQIADPKIRIIDTVWDPAKREGGKILSEQTNLAMSKAAGDWIFYIQSDEVVHEKDFQIIKKAIEHCDNYKNIDGIAFKYLHFYGNFAFVQKGRHWYQEEVRLVKNGCGIESFGDAQGFRRNCAKLKAVVVPAEIYHYGWARPPAIMAEKIKSFHKLWHEDEWIKKVCEGRESLDFFNDLGNLESFSGTHPAVAAEFARSNSTDYVSGLRDAYLNTRGLGAKLRDLSRMLPLGRHRNFDLSGRLKLHWHQAVE